MKSKSTINTASDEQLNVQKVVRNGLLLLSFAIIFLSGAALWTNVQLTYIYKNTVNITSMQTHQLHMMRISSRERTLLSYAIISETDPFKIDENRMMIYRAGSKFALARLNLIKHYLPENELRLLDKQDELANVLESKQEDMLDHVLYEKNEFALKLIREQIIPGQLKLISILDEFSLSIEKRQNDIKIEADSLSQLNIIILMLTVIIFIFGAVYIFYQTTSRTSALLSHLLNTRKTLLNSTQERTQEKDTLDHHAIVSIADRQGNITYVNDKFCEVSGYNRDELIGKNHRLLKSGEHPKEFYQDIWDTIYKGNIWQGIICNTRKDGSQYWVESTISPFLDSSGIPYQYVSIRTDITELLEAKLEEEEASKAKSKFLSSMSHELRTPMNAVLGFSQLLLMKATDDDTKENINEILTAGEHLLELINQVLELEKIESGMIPFTTDSYPLNDLLNDCLITIMPIANQKNIKIENNIDPSISRIIKVDKTQFRQIMLNLLSNAIKYNQKDGKVSVDCLQMNDNLPRITISDTGKGLTLEQQSLLFKPFERAGAENSHIPGTGLGLVICKDLIEKMNGTIGFESEAGKGSSFWIQVPIS